MERNQAEDFVNNWLFQSNDRVTEGLPWRAAYVKDAVSMVMEAVNTSQPIVQDGRAEVSEFCADCKEEFGLPDNCIGCPNDPHAA